MVTSGGNSSEDSPAQVNLPCFTKTFPTWLLGLRLLFLMKQLHSGDIHLTHLQIIWIFITDQILRWSVGEPYMKLQPFTERLGVYFTFLKQIYSQKVLLKSFK